MLQAQKHIKILKTFYILFIKLYKNYVIISIKKGIIMTEVKLKWIRNSQGLVEDLKIKKRNVNYNIKNPYSVIINYNDSLQSTDVNIKFYSKDNNYILIENINLDEDLLLFEKPTTELIEHVYNYIGSLEKIVEIFGCETTINSILECLI
jgi:hypothetical protein